MTQLFSPDTLAIIPESAPFDETERSELNLFFGRLLANWAQAGTTTSPSPTNDAEDEAPWHDPAMPLTDRMALADGKPMHLKLMAAMAQQDCGQCGYTCQTYAQAINEQAELRLNLCAPGGKDTSRMLKTLIEEMGGGVIDPEERAAKPKPATSPADLRPGYSRSSALKARFGGCRRLNGEESEKTTIHVEIDLSETGLDYAVGDSLGILPLNDPKLADAIIRAINVPPDFPIAGKPFRDVLIEETSLGAAPDALFTLISYLTGGDRRAKAKALAKGEDPDGDAATLDVLAALQKFDGIRPDPEALMEVLEPLQPRLYSISSSPKEKPGWVTLTVDVVRYRCDERQRLGVASTFLFDRLRPGATLKVYVQKAHGFALPADDWVPVIMVGPGTGIAPFRAFLQERRAIAARGPAWLFYGHQRSACDFFYADELAALQQQGVLSKLSLAWSRDGDAKVYVQTRMREEGAELFRWLESGAHFYICGDASRMARDVEAALVEVIQTHNGGSQDAASAYVKQLKKDGRFQADVY